MKTTARIVVVTIPGGRELRVAIAPLDGGIGFEVSEDGRFSMAGRIDATDWPNEHDEQLSHAGRRLLGSIAGTYDVHTAHKVALALVGLVNRLLNEPASQ